MSYLTTDEVYGNRLAGGDAQMGASIFKKLAVAVGIKSDSVQKYLDQGESLQQIYADWKPDFLRYSDTMSRIPSGSQQGTLTTLRNQLAGLVTQLDEAFMPGATPGTNDRALLAQFIDGVKDFGAQVNAVATKYGIKPASAKKTSTAGGAAGLLSASVGGIPLWLIAIAGIAIFKGKKK